MEKYYQKTVNQYAEAFHMNVKKGPNSTDFIMETIDGKCLSSIFDVLPYIHLIYYDIHARSLPGGGERMSAPNGGTPLQLNYCISGKTELMLDDNSYIYMGENDFSISCQTSRGDTYFPLKYYHGIAVYFEDGFFSAESQKLTGLFLPDATQIRSRYLNEKETFLGEGDSQMKTVMGKLWNLFGDPEIFYKKLLILELLKCLLDRTESHYEKSYIFYTNTQVEIAKKAEQILTKDLSAHIPVRVIANQFGISETSLKNYFRGVYGKNISSYLRDMRMHIAEKALIGTDLPISEIASQAGYTKQGKFAEVFKTVFGQTPLEYRRKKKLDQI